MSGLVASYGNHSPIGGHFIRQGERERAATRQAQEAETARLQNISDATTRINSAFDAPERQKQYGDFLSALRDKFQTDLGRQRDVAQRNLKFSLARGGLTGGSAAVDANRTAGEDFSRGLIEAEDRAQGALGNLKAQDESSRLNLIQLAQQGLDATTAATRAQSAARASTAANMNDAAVRGIGDAFAATADITRRQQEAAGRRAAMTAPIGSLYGKQ